MFITYHVGMKLCLCKNIQCSQPLRYNSASENYFYLYLSFERHLEKRKHSQIISIFNISHLITLEKLRFFHGTRIIIIGNRKPKWILVLHKFIFCLDHAIRFENFIVLEDRKNCWVEETLISACTLGRMTVTCDIIKKSGKGVFQTQLQVT